MNKMIWIMNEVDFQADGQAVDFDGKVLVVDEKGRGRLVEPSSCMYGDKVLCTTTIEEQPEYIKLKRERDAAVAFWESSLGHYPIKKLEEERMRRAYQTCADVLGVGE